MNSKMDWSKHQLIEELNDTAKIWRLKKPDTSVQSVNFINIDGTLLVTGDYGRWSFCREFHPGIEDVSPHYWLEKIRIGSTQETGDFDAKYLQEQIKDKIETLIETFEGDYQNENFAETLQFYKDLQDFDDIEPEYISYVNGDKPSCLDWEDIPTGKKMNTSLEVIFDAFNEINRRVKTRESDNGKS